MPVTLQQHVYPTSKPNVLNQATITAAAAHKYNVNPGVLWGIYGAESSYGKAASSFGLTGDYPGKGTSGNFTYDANRAAQILSDLLRKNGGDYEKALRAYSGGSYGLDHLKEVLKSSPNSGLSPADLPGVKQVVGAADAVKTAAADTANTVGNFFSLITSLEFWLRLGEGIAGLILIAMGLKSLTGVAVPTPIGRV